jgi:hypothetical protein
MTAGGSALGRCVAYRLRWVGTWACAGLVAMITGLAPWTAEADDGWAAGRQFGLSESSAGTDGAASADRSLVTSLAPGSVLIAQAGGVGAAAPADGWQFRVAPYLWAPRIKMTLDVGQFSRSTTIDFTDFVPQLHFVFAAHAEATWREWTGFLDLLYMSVGQSETQNGISVSTGLQEGFFEFGAMYRLPSVPLGGAGRLTFEPLAGGRFIWMHASLGFPNQKVSDSASVIDPMFGGRITYHITDTVALWFRGDAAGFGISDNQTKLTYNLLGGLEWRFSPRASALAGWRYMNIDLEKGSGSSTFNADIQMNGPFLGVNFPF